MLRGALLLLAIATLIGALMPSDVGRLSGVAADSRDRSVMVDRGAAESGDAGTDEPDPIDTVGSISLEREADGHFYAVVEINGQPVHFVVDTGASGIALTQDDARRAGIPFSPGEFEVVGRGASGDVRGSTVSIDRARLGHRTVEGIGGIVMEGGGQSLLGQNFLGKFEAVEIRGDTMTLR